MRNLLLLLLVATVAGCDLLVPIEEPVAPAVSDRQAAWQQHNRVLDSLEAWRIDGRISVRLDEEAWHATIIWQQIDQAYHIQLFGPFGSGAVRLDGSPQSVVLNSDGQQTISDDPEQLLYSQLGWRVPVNGLRYWAVGKIMPGKPSTLELDAQGRLVRLQQGGWTIRYRRYTTAAGYTLPAKVFMENQRLDVRLVIDSWQTTGKPAGTPGLAG